MMYNMFESVSINGQMERILNLIANKDLSESRKQVHEEIWNEHGNAVNNVVNYLTSL